MGVREIVGLCAVAVAAGCTGPTYSYSGYVMETYFPFDGQRDWEFVSTDVTIDEKLVGVLDSEVQTDANGTRIYTIDYAFECLDEGVPCDGEGPLRQVKWSSDQTKGVLIHAASAGSYDPPITLASPRMAVGDTVETVSGGVTFVASFDAITECPVKWTDAWDECVHISLDDGGAGDEMAGDYYAVVGYNVVAMELTDDTGQWQLSYTTYNEGDD